MKKFFFYVLAAFAMMAVGCNKENNQPVDTPEGNTPEGNTDATSVIGTWNLQHDDDFETLVLSEENTYELLKTNLYKEEGTYIYGSNTLTLTPTKGWERDYMRDEEHGSPIFDENGNFQYTEWNEVQPWSEASTHQVKMLYEGDVMLLKTTDDHSGEVEEVWAPYVKENATHVSNISDIQGKWYWLMGEAGVPRVIVNVTGSNGDIIICPWSERYVGTIRYEKGVIYMDNPTFYTTRYEDEDGGWEHINELDPENSDWRIPGNGNYGQPSFGMVSMGFVVDGNVAYGGVANLLARFTRQ